MRPPCGSRRRIRRCHCRQGRPQAQFEHRLAGSGVALDDLWIGDEQGEVGPGAVIVEKDTGAVQAGLVAGEGRAPGGVEDFENGALINLIQYIGIDIYGNGCGISVRRE